MDFSVAEMSNPGPCQISVPNQYKMEFPQPAKTVKAENKPPKRRRRGNKAARTVSVQDVEEDEAYGRLSDVARDKILKLKKIQNPFDGDLQQAVDDVFIHIEGEDKEKVDLAESALCISAVTQVFGKQVNSLYGTVLDIAERCTGRPNPQKKNRKKKGEGEDNNAANPSETEERDVGAKGQVPSNEKDTNDNTETHEDIVEVTPGSVELEVPNQDADSNEINDAETPEISEIINQTEPNAPSSGENSGDNANGNVNEAMPTVEEAPKLEQQIMEEILGHCTRRQSDRLKNILCLEKVKERDYTLKKKKFDEDPPDLTSCHDEWNEILANIEDSVDIDEEETSPPVLELMVGRKRKRLTIINNNNEDYDDGDCEACQSEVPQIGECESSTDPAITRSSETDPGYKTLDHLSNDVQEQFHVLVQELHALPSNYDPNDQNTFKVYQKALSDAIELLRENSILVKNRSKEDDLIAEPGPSELNSTQMSESDKNLSSIEELLNQVRQQATEDYCKNKGKQTISEAEVPISQMIATLKRIICGRFKKWHARTDGDKNAYFRIKEFENKVKAVLKKEAEQGLFDVKKYEMEVMDVTLKESQETEPDEFLCPLSPAMASSRSDDPRNLMLMNSPSRRSSVNGSVDGSNWISVTNIFSGMKKYDHSEVCRTFTTILGMLGNKSLAINYDTLPSQESAKLITKLMRKCQTGDVVKYPVGAKIMASRCPDMDRDEVLLTPVLTASIQRALEQDGDLSSSGYQSDGQASGSTSGASYVPRFQQKSIEDAMKEFVADPDDDNPVQPDIEDYLPKRKRKN